MTTATAALKQDHRNIERLLQLLDRAVRRLEQGEDVSPDLFRKAVTFITTFADACHHIREEDILFPALEQHGIPRRGGPVGVMLLEHEEGRNFVRGLREAVEKYAAGDKGAVPQIVQNAKGYSALLGNHIYKEDNILYVMADRVLDASAQEALLKTMQETEDRKLGPGKREKMLALLEELAKA